MLRKKQKNSEEGSILPSVPCHKTMLNQETQHNAADYYTAWNVIYLPYLFSYKTGFPSLEWLQITKSDLWNFAIIRVKPFLINPKDLDLSYKMDLDFWNCFESKITVL